MALELKDRWTWDFWTAKDGDTYHLFFLNAPRSLPAPVDRHVNARVGHATSKDLVNWTEHAEAIGPSPPPAYDDDATWTGCTIKRPDGKWMMFYTGCTRAEDWKIQRICAAVSDDLHTWTKLPENPLFGADARYYDTLDFAKWHDEAWRDPWVFQIPGDPRWHMTITARGKEGPLRGRGAIAHAVSQDLVNWTVKPPVHVSDRYGQMEVTQVFELEGRWYCLFCVAPTEMEPAYLSTGKSGRAMGTHYLMGDGPLGPWRVVEDRFMAGDPVGRLYAGRMVVAPDGKPVFLAFLHDMPDGSFSGTLSDPMPMLTLPDGRLRVDATRYGISNF
jgi:beta-fructofuranosidase